MKTVVLSAPNIISIVDKEKPALSAKNEVLVKIKYVGICGSDLHFFRTGRIGSSLIKAPFILGHEASGIIEQVGSAVSTLKQGDYVTIDPAFSCNKCDQCHAGRKHTCRNMKFHGNPGEKDGLLQEFVVLPEECCFKIMKTLSLQSAALLEPLAVALYSTFFIGTDIKKAAILGCGPIGLLVLLSLRQQFFNADIYVTDKINDRLSVAGDQGALWAGNPLEFDIVRQIEEMVPQGLDVVFECCGQQDAINQAIKLLKPGGSLIIVGIPETKEIAFDIHKIRRKEIAIFNVRRQNETYPKTIESVHSGQIDLSGLVSHVFHYSESQRAFDIANNYEDSVIKALIKFD